MAGFIYALINPSLEGLVKVGRTDRDPGSRVKEISAPTGVPTQFTLAYRRQVGDSAAAESFVWSSAACGSDHPKVLI
jgi:hypothetical protein